MPVNLRRNELEPLSHPVACYSAAFVVLALVAIVSLLPVPDMGGSDKLLHFAAYAGLSAGFALLVRNLSRLLWVVFGLVLYGVALEFLQGLTGYRLMDIADMLANTVGVVVGVAVWFTPLPIWFRKLEGRIA